MRIQVTAVCIALASSPVLAATDAPALPDSYNAVPAPVVRYDSAFSDYRAYREEQVGSWREHNEEMGRIGGHSGHLKSAPESAAAEGPAAPNDAADHGAHHKR